MIEEEEKRSSPDNRPGIAQIMEARFSRRGLLKTSAGLVAGSALIACEPQGGSGQLSGPYGFMETAWEADGHLHVPPGYRADALLRWGDPLFSDSPPFNPYRPSAASQKQQFGYNCDFTAYIPLQSSSGTDRHGLLAVNHEFSVPPLMYPNSPAPMALDSSQMLADMAAHGMSVVEIVRTEQGWTYNPKSSFNHRITPHTQMQFDGPAAGHRRLRHNGRDGFTTHGTWNNCAGGVTPWGTVLTAEENFNLYFHGNPAAGPEAENHRRYGVSGEPIFGWYQVEKRWELNVEPSYPLHAGWIVEIDPRHPERPPIKHTALGRMKHEGCELTVNGDGRLVCYMGDDQRFEYLYRYVSDRRLQDEPDGQRLLREGELSVAVFHADGTLSWHPLVYGQGALVPSNGFHNQGDVLLDTRRAADLWEATPMDRPEGIAVHPNGQVYCALTGNHQRERPNPPNPRPENLYGHILEMVPPGGDHTASRFGWEIFLMAGRNRHESRLQHPKAGDGSYFVNPDNLVFDPNGTLWIATDGATSFGLADALMVCDIEGSKQRHASRFLTAPAGAEVTGPSFTPDKQSLFVSIQHPGMAKGSNFEQPITRWPDFHKDTPPRPSVVAITREDGGKLLG